MKSETQFFKTYEEYTNKFDIRKKDTVCRSTENY